TKQRVGQVSMQDVYLVRADLASAEDALRQAVAGQQQARRALEILLGRYPAAKLAADSDLPTIDREIPSGLPSDLLIRRPDLLSAERRFAAAEKRVSEARRAFFPRITLTGSAGSLSGQLEDLVDGDFSVWSIAAGLTQPLFQGGRLVGNYRQSAAVSDMALADYALAILTAFGEVESALYAEEVLARREGHSAEAARQSELAQQLAERQYGAGLVGYITVLETQRRALNSQSELISVRRRRLDARVNLYLALGGGFDLAQEWTRFLAGNNAEETRE
ncbi:MAG: efflux transporter outer membrane subunit, partial [bacterium]|nr:efflux transporter outer membrane subunit [bacterium]